MEKFVSSINLSVSSNLLLIISPSREFIKLELLLISFSKSSRKKEITRNRLDQTIKSFDGKRIVPAHLSCGLYFHNISLVITFSFLFVSPTSSTCLAKLQRNTGRLNLKTRGNRWFYGQQPSQTYLDSLETLDIPSNFDDSSTMPSIF